MPFEGEHVIDTLQSLRLDGHTGGIISRRNQRESDSARSLGERDRFKDIHLVRLARPRATLARQSKT
jgi:hypothetical protein